MEGGRGGEADFDGIEIVDDTAVFGDVVFEAAEGEFGFGEFAVEQVAAVAFVDDDAVVLVDGGRRGTFFGVEDAVDHALHGGNVDGGGGVGRLAVDFLDAKGVGKGLQVFHARVFEGVGGLFTKGRTVDQEENAAEALGLEEPVDEGDASFGFAGAGGHGEQQAATAGGDAAFDGADGIFLVGAKGEAVVEFFAGEFLFGGGFVAFEEDVESGGGVPAFKGAADVVGAAEVSKPDAAAGFELAEEGAAIGGEGERDAVGIPRSAGAIELAGNDVAAVAFRLLQGTGDVDVFAFSLDDGYGVGTDEEDVVGWATAGGPFGDGEVATAGGAGAEVVA